MHNELKACFCCYMEGHDNEEKGVLVPPHIHVGLLDLKWDSDNLLTQ